MKLQAIVSTALIAAAAFFSTSSLSAQTQAAPAGKPKMSREEHDQKRLDETARQLNLTPEQKEKFAQTDRTYDEKMKAAHSARKEDMDKLREERAQAHRGQLTKEQTVKYDQMLADKKAKREAHEQHKGDKKHGKAPKTKDGQTPAPAPGGASDKFHKD